MTLPWPAVTSSTFASIAQMRKTKKPIADTRMMRWEPVSGTRLTALFIHQSNNTKVSSQFLPSKGTLDPARFAELREVQGEWMRWRHRHCTWDAAPSRGGPVQPMRYAGCVAAQTLARIDALKYHLCPDGGKAGDCEASRRYDP